MPEPTPAELRRQCRDLLDALPDWGLPTAYYDLKSLLAEIKPQADQGPIDSAQTRHGRPVVTAEMAEKTPCPFRPDADL